jgi:twitching motility protein PilI
VTEHEIDPTAGTPTGLLLPTKALLGGFEFNAAAAADHASVGVRAFAGEPNACMQARQGFRVGSINLMIRYEDGSELTELPPVHCLPNAPGWFAGMANLHGRLVPVFELARYLGVERDLQGKRMLLVLSRGADAAGMVIDGIPERLRWSDNDRVDAGAAPQRLAPNLRGACLIGERLWFDLECGGLLDALEHAMATSE